MRKLLAVVTAALAVFAWGTQVPASGSQAYSTES